MGIFDRFRKTKKKEEKEVKEKPKVKAEKKEEIKQQAVMTPDGRLVSVPKKEEKAKKIKIKKEDTGNAYRVLVKPRITEKGSSLGVYNQYVFEVADQTNKIEVRKAIKKVYGVDPIKVNIINMSGKKVRYGRTEGRTKNWKKAIVTLAPGQKIEMQEGL